MFPLRLYLFAYYLGLGAILPLLAVGLEARGLRPSQYAWVIVLIPLSRLVTPPLWGALADRYVGAMPLLRVNTALSSVAMGILFVTTDLWTTIAALAVWALLSSSLVPLVEASAYRMLGPSASSFAYIRVFGSIGFATSALGLGLAGVDSGVRLPFALAAAAYVLAALSTLGFAAASAPARSPLMAAMRGLAVRPDTALLWLGSVLYYLAHGAFDMYFGPYARTLPGVSLGTISAAWSIGVIAEVIVVWFVPRWLDSRAERYLLVGSALVAALRWALLARASSSLELLLLQPLHGVTFGVWYLAFVHQNQARVPDRIRATVQGIAQACIGAGSLGATLLGGYVLERFGGRVLFGGASCAAVLASLCYAARSARAVR